MNVGIHHMGCHITRPNTIDFFPVGSVKSHVCRTPVRDLADLQEGIYAAGNNVTPQTLHNTWIEVEYRLDISHATNGN